MPQYLVHFQTSGQSGRAGPACWRLAKAARHSRIDPKPPHCRAGLGWPGQAESGKSYPAVRLSIRSAGRDHRISPRRVLHEPNLYLSRPKNRVCPDPVIQLSPNTLQ